MHIDPLHGLGLDAVRQFCRAGGTHIILVAKTARDWGIDASTADEFSLAYSRTISLAEEISSSTDAQAFPIVGFHPAEFVGIAQKKGTDYALALGRELADVWKELFDQHRILGVGEVGRPHYPVPDEVWDASNSLLADYLLWAADNDVPMQLHTEHFEKEQFEEVGGMIRANGDAKRIIKHFSPPLPDIALSCSMHSSIVSSRSSITDALGRSNEFFMETDYIDDLTRPGSVMGPRTVPRRTLALLESGAMTEKDAAMIHIRLPQKIYGIDMEKEGSVGR